MDFKLSKELERILSMAKIYSAKNGFTEITLEGFFKALFDVYCDESDASLILDSTVVKNFISRVVTSEGTSKKESYDRLKDFWRDSLERFGDQDSPVSEDECSSLEYLLGMIFNSANTSKGLNKSKYIKVPEEITTDEFFTNAAILAKTDDFSTSTLIDFVRKYNVDETEVMKDFHEVMRGDGGSNVLVTQDKLDSFDPFNLEGTKKEDEEVLGEGSKSGEEAEGSAFSSTLDGGINYKKIDKKSKTKYLDTYAKNMNNLAKNGAFDPVIGRSEEIQRIVEILSCRKKNNAVLLGDPGCGKTSVVEELARMIVNSEVPAQLSSKIIFSLDLNGLVAGTKYRGEYEERLQNIIKEVTNNKDIIVYIDEFHNLIGNGNSSGSGDASNILKPYLANGQFQCIGSTTTEEYRKFIEKDSALKRRFQSVMIEEPSVEDTKKILAGVAPTYSNFHKVTYSEEIINKCVELSARYVTESYFPDKAISVLDLAGSLAKLNNPVVDFVLSTYEAEYKDLREQQKDYTQKGEFEKARECSEKAEEVKKSIDTFNAKNENNNDTTQEVTLDEVAEVISRVSKVPVDVIKSSDFEKLKNTKSILGSKVIGQSEAVSTISNVMLRNFMGLRDPKKPLASLFFVGPTGTGKTLICKELAKQFFGNEKALIRLDMNEYSSEIDKTKLLGSAPGFVGYDEPVKLDEVRRRPYSVVLFDEIEKAHPSIMSTFLNILDEGYIVLQNGVRVDFKNCIIVFTSNTGTSELLLKGSGLGFSTTDKSSDKKFIDSVVMKAVEKNYKPEFINRLSKIVVFNKLSKEDLKEITKLEVTKLNETLKVNSKVEVSITDALVQEIVDTCDARYNARDIQRKITSLVQEAVCEKLLDSEFTVGVDEVKANVDFKDGNPVVALEKA